MNLRQELSTLQKTRSDNFIVIPGASELLLHVDIKNNPWQKNILNNRHVALERTLRNSLSKTLDVIFTSVPFVEMNLITALDQKILPVTTVTNLFVQFSELLEMDTYTKQLVLYIPFELIPEKAWSKTYPELESSINLFTHTYVKKWRELLNQKVPRANFVDGDILEYGMYDNGLPLVVKAAHLIPFLFQKQLISFSEILELIETTSDTVLQESILDTIPVLFSMNLVTSKMIQQMLSSKNTLLRNTCIIAKQSVYVSDCNQSLIDFRNKLITAFASIKDEYEQQLGTCSESRRVWKKRADEKKEIEKTARVASETLIGNVHRTHDLKKFVTENTDIVSQKLAVSVIRNLVEQFALSGNITIAETLKHDFSGYIQTLEENEVIELKDLLETLWYRWYSIGLISESELATHDLKPAQLLSGNTVQDRYWYTEAVQLATLCETIASNSQFSDYLYPVCIMYGSSVKGYADKNADIDIAVFVKPHVPFSKRSHVQNILSKLFVKTNGKALEFWTKKTANALVIQDYNIEDRSLGQHVMSHVLFHGIWCGEKKTIQTMFQDLLPHYLYEQNTMYYGHPIREAYVSELERDALQYRLMHKGYYRFYPNQNPLSTYDAKDIDGDSAFWDSGYRRIATKLFVDKVFMPLITTI